MAETNNKLTLTNGELKAMQVPLQMLNQQRLPYPTTKALVKLSLKIQDALRDIEEHAEVLRQRHGVKNPHGQYYVPRTLKQLNENTKKEEEIPNPAYEDFGRDYAELLEQTQEIEFEGKIKLPEKVASTCDKCHHNMDRPLEIAPEIILPLEKFIDIN